MSKFEGYLAEGAFCPVFAQGLPLPGKAAAGSGWLRPARPALLGLALAVLVSALLFLVPGDAAEAQIPPGCTTYTVPPGDRTNRTPNSAAGVITIPVQTVPSTCPNHALYTYLDLGTSSETYVVSVRSKATENRDGSGAFYYIHRNDLMAGAVSPPNRPDNVCKLGGARSEGAGSGSAARQYPQRNCVVAGGSYTIFTQNCYWCSGSSVEYDYFQVEIQLRRITLPAAVARDAEEDVILHLGEARIFNISDFFSGTILFPDSATHIDITPLVITAPGATIAADNTAQTFTFLGSSLQQGTATIAYQARTAKYIELLGMPVVAAAGPTGGAAFVRNLSNLSASFPFQVRARALPGQEPKTDEKYFTLDPLAGWDASAVQDDAQAWFVELSWDSVTDATGYVIEARDNGRHLRVSRLTDAAFVQANRTVSLPRTPGSEVGTSGQPLTYVVARVRAYQTQINNEEWYSPWTEERAVTFFDGEFPRPPGVPLTFADPLGLLSIANAVSAPLGFGDNGRGLLLVAWAVAALGLSGTAAWIAGRRAWTPAGLIVGGLMFTILWTILGPIYGGVSIPWAIGPLIPLGILGAFALRKQAGG